MFPPTDPTLDPLGLPPAPQAPAVPQPVQPKALNPIAQAVMLAVGALAGPGKGTGIMQGLNLANQQAQQRAQLENARLAQDYTRQHQAYQDEQRTYQQQYQQRGAMLKNVLDSFQTELANTTSDTEAENLYQTAGQVLAAQGFRGFDADRLKRTYKSPDMVTRVNKAIVKWVNADPANKKLYETDPEAVANFTLPNVGGAPMTFRQAWEITGSAAPLLKPKPAPTGSQTPREGVIDGKSVFWTLGPDGQTQIVQGVSPTPPAPKEPPAPRNKVPVTRNGQLAWIEPGTQQNGDVPYDAASAKPAGAPKLSATQQEDVTTMLVVERMASDAEALGDKTNWDGVGGFAKGTTSAFMAKNFGKGSETGIDLRSQIGNIKGTIAKLRGGTSFTPSEQKMLEDYTPTIDDNPKVIKGKLQSLRRFIANKRLATVQVASGDFTPLPSHGADQSGNGTVTVGGQTFGVQVIP